MRPSSNSRAPTAAANLGREHQTALEGTQGAPRKMRRQGAATPGATHRVSVGGAPSVRLPRQPHTAPLKRLRPHLAMAAPIRRKAPREHRGKCGGRARQPRGPLTGCLWDVPPASACRGSRTPPRSGAFRLLPCQAPSARDRKMIRNDPAPKFVQTAIHSLIQTRRGDLTLAAASSMRLSR